MKELREVYIDGGVKTWYVRYAERGFRQRYLAAQFDAKDNCRNKVVSWVNAQPHLKLIGEKEMTTDSLTDAQVLRVLAKRDGVEIVEFKGFPHRRTHGISCTPFDYLESRDALQPILSGLIRNEWRKLEERLDAAFEVEAERGGPPTRIEFALRLSARDLAYAIAWILKK